MAATALAWEDLPRERAAAGVRWSEWIPRTDDRGTIYVHAAGLGAAHETDELARCRILAIVSHGAPGPGKEG